MNRRPVSGAVVPEVLDCGSDASRQYVKLGLGARERETERAPDPGRQTLKKSQRVRLKNCFYSIIYPNPSPKQMAHAGNSTTSFFSLKLINNWFHFSIMFSYLIRINQVSPSC